ncbi:MAG: ABC transporter permease subunit [Phycisphaerae bacterium]|nr:ABC transporter permease subunit [Phycisphaerae bacterium]
MSRAVLLKTLRDYLLLTVILTLSIVLLELMIVRVLVEAAHDLEMLRSWLERPFMKTLIRLALGADLVGDMTPTTLATFGLGHPLLYALSWTLLLTIGTGVVAGEIGRGTADLLLTLPVSRRAVYTSTSVAWVLAAILASASPLVGLWLGERAFPLPEPLDFSRLWPVAANFLALNLSIGGVTMFVSSLVSRRGIAVAVVLSVLFASDLVNLTVQFWDALKPISFLGFLHYYRLLPVVRSAELPVGNILTLLAIAAVAWTLGLWRFSRRDIPAV